MQIVVALVDCLFAGADKSFGRSRPQVTKVWAIAKSSYELP